MPVSTNILLYVEFQRHMLHPKQALLLIGYKSHYNSRAHVCSVAVWFSIVLVLLYFPQKLSVSWTHYRSRNIILGEAAYMEKYVTSYLRKKIATWNLVIYTFSN